MKSNRFIFKAAILAALTGLLLLTPASVVQAKTCGATIDGINASIQTGTSASSPLQSLITFWTDIFAASSNNSEVPSLNPEDFGSRDRPHDPRGLDGGENGCIKMQKP